VQNLSHPPEGVALPPLEDILDGPPTSWLGRPVEWLNVPKIEPLFLRAFDLRPISERTHLAFLFGARYNLEDALVDGESYGDGFFVEYFVVDKPSGEWTLHRLLQRGSVAYTESDESRADPQYLPACEIKDPAVHSLRRPPAWKASAASWPTHRGLPMQFIGQMTLPKTELTSSLFTWGDTAYLFVAVGDGRLVYKLFEQETHGQTAEEHYALEDEIFRRAESAASNGS
jgi:hypothetical protein